MILPNRNIFHHECTGSCFVTVPFRKAGGLHAAFDLKIQISSKDVIVLSSDGRWDVLEMSDNRQQLRRHPLHNHVCWTQTDQMKLKTEWLNQNTYCKQMNAHFTTQKQPCSHCVATYWKLWHKAHTGELKQWISVETAKTQTLVNHPSLIKKKKNL